MSAALQKQMQRTFVPKLAAHLKLQTHSGCLLLGFGEHDIEEIGRRWDRRNGLETACRHRGERCVGVDEGSEEEL